MTWDYKKIVDDLETVFTDAGFEFSKTPTESPTSAGRVVVLGVNFNAFNTQVRQAGFSTTWSDATVRLETVVAESEYPDFYDDIIAACQALGQRDISPAASVELGTINCDTVVGEPVKLAVEFEINLRQNL